MKILHTADWHLGHLFFGFDRTEEHQHFLKWLGKCIQEQEPDVLLIGGNIFDSPQPSGQTEQIFYDFVCHLQEWRPGLQTVIVAGSNDPADKLEALVPLLLPVGVRVKTHVKQSEKGGPDWKDLLLPLTAIGNEEDTATLLALPLLKQTDIGGDDDTSASTRSFVHELREEALASYKEEKPLLLLAHFPKTEEGLSTVNCDGLGQRFHYVALGGSPLFEEANGQANVRYSGSPLHLSFEDRTMGRGINCISIQPDQTYIEWLDYEPLRPLLSLPEEKGESVEDVLKHLCKIPKGLKAEGCDDWPYLELRLANQDMEPTIADAIQRTLEGRRVRLCRIIRTQESGNLVGDAAWSFQETDLEKMNPAYLAREQYKKVYGEEMPDEIAKLFAEAKRIANQHELENQE